MAWRTMWRIAVTTAILGTALTVGPPVGAATTEIAAVVVADGTPTFDADDMAGNDSGASNLRVRTFDLISYRLDWNVNDLDATNVVIGAALTGGAAWQEVPYGCLVDGVDPQSTLSPDGATLTCNVGDRQEGSSGAVFADAVVGGVLDGTLISLTATVTDDSGAVSGPVAAADIQATATPRVNLSKTLGAPSTFPNRTNGVTPLHPTAGVPGMIACWPVVVEVAGTGKGSESLAGTFSFTEDLSAISPNTEILSWDFDPTGHGIGNWDHTINGAQPNDLIETTPWGAIGIDIGGRNDDVYGPATALNSVVDSGTWSYTVDSANPQLVTVTVTGADTSTASFPQSAGSASVSLGGRRVLASGTICTFTPQADFGGARTLDATNAITGFDPVGISGTSNFGTGTESEADNQRTFALRFFPPGGRINIDGDWYSRAQDVEPAPGTVCEGIAPTHDYDDPQDPGFPYVPGQVGRHSGDGPVGGGMAAVAYGQLFFKGQTNAGLLIKLDPASVDPVLNPTEMTVRQVNRGIFDNDYQLTVSTRTQALDSTVPFRTGAYDNPGPDCGFWSQAPNWQEGVDYEIEYAALPAAAAASWGDWAVGGSTARVTDGNDANGPWFDDPADVPGGVGNIAMIRLLTLHPPATPGVSFESIWMEIGAEILPAAPGTPVPLWVAYTTWDGSSAWDGDETWNTGSYDPQTHSGSTRTGDRLLHASYGLTLDKRISDWSSGDELINGIQVTTREPGEPIGFELDWRVSPVTAAQVTATDVTITDILWPEMEYIDGSASVPPASVTILPNGRTEIVWRLGDVATDDILTPITYQGQVRPGTGPLGVTINQATLSSAEVGQAGGPNADGSVAGVRTPGPRAEAMVTKAVDGDVIDPDGDVVFDLTYRNVGSVDLDAGDLIDVLPFVGDSGGDVERTPPSDFAGTAMFRSIVGSAGETFRYSSADPTTIDLDPLVASNAPGGATLWCEATDTDPAVPDFGAPGCPVGDDDVTAVRVATPALATGEERTLRLTLATSGNTAGDRYTNNFSGRIPDALSATSLELRVISNDVFILVRPTIGDTVWLDSDGDGTQDPDETGIEGVVIELLDANGTVVTTTTTGPDGTYTFTVEVGTWTTRISPTNFEPGNPLNNLTPTLDHDGDNTGDNQATTTLTTTNITHHDYGYQPTPPPAVPLAVTGAGTHKLVGLAGAALLTGLALWLGVEIARRRERRLVAIG